MGVRITMAGQDITDWVDELSLDVESNLGQGPGVPQGASGRATTGKFDCYLGPQASAYGSGQTLPTGGKPVLVRQGEVIIYDASGNRIFGGYATDFVDKTDFTVIKTQVTCSDYWQDLARVVINQIYTSEYDNQILADLFSSYAPQHRPLRLEPGQNVSVHQDLLESKDPPRVDTGYRRHGGL